MTDSTEILDLVDDSQEVFPAKEDMKDRLALVWVTGKTGTRKGTGPDAKPYTWVETVTMIVDDSPEGWQPQVFDEHTRSMRDNRIPSVTEGPTVLENFQFSFGGMVSRLQQRIGTDGKPKTFKPLFGRINSRPNRAAGMNPSWSVATPTPEEHQAYAPFAAQIREISARMEKASAVVDEFDE